MIVLIQVISARSVTPEESTPTNQTMNLSGGASSHRLHALALVGESVHLYPVVFKSGAQTKNKKQL